MKNFRVHHYVFIALIFAVIDSNGGLHAHNETASIPELVGMTPEQFDQSLSIGSHEHDADKEFNKGLNVNIDSSSTSGPSSIMSIDNSAEISAPSNNNKPSSIQPHSNPQAPLSLSAEEDTIEFNFENADLQMLIRQIEELYSVKFITDDILNPPAKSGKPITGNKISFKTNTPLNKAQAWNLFITFLDIADLSLVPESDPTIFRITSTANAQKAPIPTYIGVKADALPDNDQLVRYLYFIENTSLETIDGIIQALRSSASAYLVLKDMNGFVLTDKASHIKSLMNIIKELDRVNIPQSMSVLKLMRADAMEVKKLYDSITQVDDTSITARLFPARKQPTTLYFPENTRLIAEERTNSLILLGPIESIKKIEEFIMKHVDVELGEESMSPLRVYPLKYAQAESVAAIMNDITQFGHGSKAQAFGGVRDNDKYIKSLNFTAEPSTNRLIIKGDEADYLQTLEIIKKLDEPQPQIAMEVLILSVDLTSRDALGTQLRSQFPGVSGPAGKNIAFQTSGLSIGTSSGIQTNTSGTGTQRLLGNLINLLVGGAAGNTVLTLGSDQFGVWGIFNALQTVSNTQVISNPFLVATNKQKASVTVGETRRVISSTVVSTTSANSKANNNANLSVIVTPQINSDGMIVLDLDIAIDSFTNTTNQTDGTKETKRIKTTTVVADNEVLALGGLIKNTTVTSVSKLPILGDIPILGWLCKAKNQTAQKKSLLILISSHILPAEKNDDVSRITKQRIHDYHGTINNMKEVSDNRDPIHRAFFSNDQSPTSVVDDFLFKRKQIQSEALKVANNTNNPITTRHKKRDNKKKSAKRRAASPDAAAQNSIVAQAQKPSTAASTIIGVPLIAPPPSKVTITQTNPVIPTKVAIQPRSTQKRSLSTVFQEEVA